MPQNNDQPASDEQLLRSFVGGDRRALASLADRYETKLLGLTSAMLGGQRDLACDVVQETWLRVIRFGASFNGNSSLKTWLYRIAINQCRTLQSARPTTHHHDDQQPPPSCGRTSRDAEAVPDDEALRFAVDSMRDEHRTILLLCYHSGLTHEQAAEVLEIPVGTLKSRLHAALTALRDTLSQDKQS
jgi:RNA polymerase sigma-70 factor (ECF subfamily)